ncbi:MAG: TRAP transporter small permease [Burkholderiales bacterium]
MAFLPPLPPSILPVRLLARSVEWSIIAIGAVMIVLVFFNVVVHQFGRDMAWTTELCELLMVWVTFLGGAAAAHRGAHMSITEFLDKLPERRRLLADGAIQLVTAAMLVLLVRYGWGIVDSSWENILTVLNIPMAVQYLALPVGAGATLIFVAHDLVQIARGRSRAERYGEE